MLTPNTDLHIPMFTNSQQTYTVKVREATMYEAITWMNAPTNVLERFDRKHALLTYLNASINLAAIKEAPKLPEVSPKG